MSRMGDECIMFSGHKYSACEWALLKKFSRPEVKSPGYCESNALLCHRNTYRQCGVEARLSYFIKLEKTTAQYDARLIYWESAELFICRHFSKWHLDGFAKEL